MQSESHTIMPTFSSAIPAAHNYSRWIVDTFRPYIGGKVLEVGFGHDSYSRLLRQLATEYTGADIDHGAVERARHESPGGRFFVWDVSDSSQVEEIGRGRYDTVMCFNVIEHVHADQAAIDNLLSLLAPSGRLLLFVPAFQFLYTSIDRLAGHLRR